MIPNAAHPKRIVNTERVTTSSADKRDREEDGADSERKAKKEKADDSDDEEMEIDDDEAEPLAPGEFIIGVALKLRY